MTWFTRVWSLFFKGIPSKIGTVNTNVKIKHFPDWPFLKKVTKKLFASIRLLNHYSIMPHPTKWNQAQYFKLLKLHFFHISPLSWKTLLSATEICGVIDKRVRIEIYARKIQHCHFSKQKSQTSPVSSLWNLRICCSSLSLIQYTESLWVLDWQWS